MLINDPTSVAAGTYLSIGAGSHLTMDEYATVIICRNVNLSYKDVTLGEPDVSSGYKSGKTFTYNYQAKGKHGRIILEEMMRYSTLYLSYDNRTLIS